jgi:RNA polymerase sigma factor (sigma-70 family)
MNHEERLVKRAQKNIKHFAALYNLYYPKIRGYIGSKVKGDSNAADDLTSSTFEKALRSMKSFRWQGISFSAWIYRIANNTVIDHYRSSSIKNHDQIHENIRDRGEGIESMIQDSDTSDYIRNLINTLNPREKKIVMMKFYEGMTNIEIAEVMKISETNVSTIVYRTMGKLRDIIDKESI